MFDKAYPDKNVPFLHRLLWRIGINVPRPEHAPFLLNVLLFGVPFGLIWGALMTFSDRYLDIGMPVSLSFIPYIVLAGLLFGIFMAVMNHRKTD